MPGHASLPPIVSDVEPQTPAPRSVLDVTVARTLKIVDLPPPPPDAIPVSDVPTIEEIEDWLASRNFSMWADWTNVTTSARSRKEAAMWFRKQMISVVEYTNGDKP